MLPPVVVRRLVLAPAAIVVTVLVFTALPVLLIVAAVLSTVLPGRWRALRLIWMGMLYLVLESAALIVLFVLWVASGFGWKLRSPAFQRAHYDLVQWYLQILYWECRRVLHVRVDIAGPPASALEGRPLLILSRHAGPGDSFLVVHALINWYDREPRIVLKDTMQWDPAIDVLLNRLPNRFIRPNPGRAGEQVEQQIGELSRNLDGNDAFVIFPEGGNFTEHRRKRAIDKLRRKGLIDEAERAARLRHVLAPRPGGVLAALADAGDADVVFAAHTGVEHLSSVLDVWRELPMDKEITMAWWLVPAADVPRAPRDQVGWLNDWWSTIDSWIDERQVEAPAP